MNLYVKSYSDGPSRVCVISNTVKVDHKENAKALLAFLKERVPLQTRCQFGILIDRVIPRVDFSGTIREAYEDIFPKPKAKPKFTDVSIDPDLLKVIKKHCPEAIKER